MSGRVFFLSSDNTDNWVEVTGIAPLNPANARLLNITLMLSRRSMILVKEGRVCILYQKEKGSKNGSALVAL
jgi:hypothetical protein